MTTQAGKSRDYRDVIVFEKLTEFLDFPWRINVDGRPNVRKKLSVAWGPFLESPGNFSGP